MHPLIGITCSRVTGGAWSSYDAGHYMNYAFKEYCDSVLYFGAAPLLIPIEQNTGTLDSILQKLDGLLISGGPDLHPRYYKEEPQKDLGDIDEPADQMELAIAEKAVEKNIPVLAICRGIQVLNVAMDGSLYQDIPSQVEGSINHVQTAAKNVNTHEIVIEKNTRLHSIFRDDRIWVNGKHHQAIKRLATGLKTSARSLDGIIEAVEIPDKAFVLGVQWHPEGTWENDKHSRALFKAFVDAAGMRA